MSTGSQVVRRRLLMGVVTALVLLLAFHAGGGWYFASVLNERALSGEARRDALLPDYVIDVIAVRGTEISLRATGQSRLTRDGQFGLTWVGGTGILGAITARDDDNVTREFILVTGEAPAAGTRADLDGRIFQGDPLSGLGIEFEDVSIAGELGDYPAWYVPGRRSTWFIFVHGNGMTRRDALRMLPTVVEAGFPVLVPTYRNDEGAPSNPEDRLTYGKEEWRDLEAAVDYAMANGAEDVVLEGLSMGGAVVGAFLDESSRAEHVTGVILDAPMLDFEAAVEWQAEDERIPLVGLPLPFTLLNSAEYIAERRFNVDWEYTDYLEKGMLALPPTLLIHGTEDETVPVATSDALAELRPDAIVDYWRVPNAGHIEAWNVDSEEYERRMLAFLEKIGLLD